MNSWYVAPLTLVSRLYPMSELMGSGTAHPRVSSLSHEFIHGLMGKPYFWGQISIHSGII